MSEIETTRKLTEHQVNNLKKIIEDLIIHYSIEEVNKVVIPHIIQWLYDNFISIESTEEIIVATSDLNKHQDKIHKIYKREIHPLPAKSRLIQFLNTEEYKELEKAIEPRKREGTISDVITDDTEIVTNFKTKEVYSAKHLANGDIKTTTVIKAVPTEVTVYDTILLDQPRNFKITWESQLSERKFITAGETGGGTIKEIETYIIDAGFSPYPRLVGGAISSVINAFISNKLAKIQKEIDNPGFYYDSNNEKILKIKVKTLNPSLKKLSEAVEIIEELKKYFKNEEDILATILKWGWLSPFSYAKKQAGEYMPWLYLKGSAKSGKTTLAKIGMFCWREPNDEIVISGDSFSTEARIGANISKDCFCRIVNEPAGAFRRLGAREIMKNAVESTVSRNKFIGSNTRRSFPAFSPVIITANQYLPEEDALIRRFWIISFTYSMRKTDSQIRKFEETFHIKSPAISPLKKLRYIGDFFANELINDPSLLYDDWREICNTIINRLYVDLERTCPEWIMSWSESETLEDFDNNQIEDIRNFFNETLTYHRKQVKIYNENGLEEDLLEYNDDVNSSYDFKHITWSIINQRLINWIIPHISRGNNRYVCLTQGLRKAISQKIDFCSDLKSIGELMGWDYKTVKINGKNMKVVHVLFDDFLEFVYPGVDFEI